ncbi:hypothetical protein M0802_006461 [Mischocyttarus mexicanus]|nr:hypothetical protein M0802_006461 [Mischocyttarus mexicanus]
MPGHRQPKSLECLSLWRMCQHLDGMCRRLQVLSQETSSLQVLVRAKQDIRPYYINALPTSLRSQVIEETSKMLYGPSPDGTALISGPAPLYLLALLLGHDIKRLKVNLCCYYGCSHQTSLLKLLASEGTGLESLELARPALLRLDGKLLKAALLNMNNLIDLTLRNIASDSILQVIGKACSKLVTLDIACSKQVSDVGLKQLLIEIEFKNKSMHITREEPTSWSKLKALMSRINPRSSKRRKKDKHSVLLEYYENRNSICDTLRVLNVANTSVTSTGVLMALIYISRLESLAEYNNMGKVVEIMGAEVTEFETPLFLTQARSSQTTSIHMKLLAQACPKIEVLHVTEPLHPPESLNLFSCVTSLNLHSIPVHRQWRDGFYDYLRASGPNLKELSLHALQGEFLWTIDLKEIFSNCTNLRILSMDNSSVEWSEGPDPPPLRYLKKVRLGHTVNALAIIKMISLLPELIALHIHSCTDLTNEHLDELLTKPERFKSYRTNRTENSLVQNIICFYIYEASKISVNTVLKMFHNCKHLRRIGNLNNWGLDCVDISLLKSTVENENLDMDFCTGSHWFWSNCIQ